MFDNFRWSVFEFAWRLNFAGRMIEKTRCSLKTGWNFAKEVQLLNPHVMDAKPSDVADYQIRTGLTPMLYVNTKEEIDIWFQSAQAGEIACYGIADEKRYPMRFMIEHARGYYENELAHLFQKKQLDGSIHYLIKKGKGNKYAASQKR